MLVRVIVKFPLADRTLVATGVHWTKSFATFVLIKVVLVCPDCPLIQFSTAFAPDKLMPAMFGRLVPAAVVRVRLVAESCGVSRRPPPKSNPL